MTLLTITQMEWSMENSLLIAIIILGGCYIVATTVVAVLKLIAEKNRQEVDLIRADAQGKVMTAKPFKDLIDTLNAIVDFYVAHEIVLVINGKIIEDERGDLLVQYTASISALVLSSLSPELLRQFSYYVEVSSDPNEEDYIKYYIRKSVMLKLTTVINTNVRPEPRMVQPAEKKEDKA